MSDPVPSLPFTDLLAYTDYLAQRWLDYFERNPAALTVDVGGRAGTVGGLVTHIFQVEQFFADLLLQEGAGATARPGTDCQPVAGGTATHAPGRAQEIQAIYRLGQ